MITIKSYAELHNVSYEAVRQMVKRYSDDLDGHVTSSRPAMLDDFAVDFLDAKRSTNKVVILNENKDEELNALKEENKALLLKVAALQEQLISVQESNLKLLSENTQLLLEKEKEENKRWWHFWK